MKPRLAPGQDLARVFAAEPLVRAWFTGHGDGPGASADLAACLASGPGGGPAPWFVCPAAEAWAAELAADLADDAERDRLRDNLAALRAGRAGVVVTGQQPGFLGGPLYTLYKVATAVALARRMNAAGRPTVPVFWSGDDDDDVREALAPVAWLLGTDEPVRSEQAGAARRERALRRVVGRLPVAAGQTNAAAWLRSLPPVPGDTHAPAEIWAQALARRWTWGRLQRRALLRTFAGSGLLVVSGDDHRLHEAAAPLYARILADREELAEAARARGRELVAAGWHAQIGEASLARPLFVDHDGQRRPLGQADPQDVGRLRPGVMLRSPVQDWLLRPVAVVVGPGEFAYLRQLTAVYRDLGVARCPLVPRLFAWLLPEGFDRTMLASHGSARHGEDVETAEALDRWQQEAARHLRSLLVEGLHLTPERGEALTAGRMRRWRRGLDAALRGEFAARARAAKPAGPVWIFPDGMRQERHLAWGAARAVWGPELTAALLAAAERHLASGAGGTWHEWEITVTKPGAGHV